VQKVDGGNYGLSRTRLSASSVTGAAWWPPVPRRHGPYFEATIRSRQFSRAMDARLMSMSSQSLFEVRAATQRDARAIAAIHQAEGLAGRPTIDWRQSIEFSEPQVQVALDGGQVVGFVRFDHRDKGTPPTTGEIWVIRCCARTGGAGAELDSGMPRAKL